MGPVEAGIPRTTPASPAPASRRWQALQQASKASPSSTVLGRSTVSPDRGAASFLRDLRAGRGEVFLLGRELLFALHELAVPTDLGIERRLLVFEELHNLLLPHGDLGLPRGNVLHMGDRLGVTSSDVLVPPHERFEAFCEFLFARHQRVLLREHLLSRGIELLLPLGNRPLALLELFLAGPQPFLPADERVPLFRKRGPFLFEDPAIFLDFGGLILKGGLAPPSFRILGLQAFFHFLQCI